MRERVSELVSGRVQICQHLKMAKRYTSQSGCEGRDMGRKSAFWRIYLQNSNLQLCYKFMAKLYQALPDKVDGDNY